MEGSKTSGIGFDFFAFDCWSRGTSAQRTNAKDGHPFQRVAKPARVTHSDAHPAFFEHVYIVRHIAAHCGDPARRYEINSGQKIDHAPFVGGRIGNVQIKRLRPRCRNVVRARQQVRAIFSCVTRVPSTSVKTRRIWPSFLYGFIQSRPWRVPECQSAGSFHPGCRLGSFRHPDKSKWFYSKARDQPNPQEPGKVLGKHIQHFA
jgi:hypothetical protein